MATFNIQSQTTHVTATYSDEDKNLRVDVNYDIKSDTAQLTSINGGIYRSDTYAGSFNGNRNGDEMNYTFGGVRLADMADVTQAVQNIEAQITAQNQD